MRLSGTSSAGHRFGGVLAYDRTRQALTRFDMVHYHEQGHADRNLETGGPAATKSGLGVSFELAAGDTAFDRLYPIAFTLEWGGSVEEHNRPKIARYLGSAP